MIDDDEIDTGFLQLARDKTIPISPECKSLVEAFERESAQYLTSLEQRYTPPSRIYHYTTAAGLFGILESGALWLTDIKDANDPSELKHGISIATQEAVKASADHSGPARVFAKAVSHLSERVYHNQHFHTCCFSPNHDDLDQWRRYSNGQGFCIGFDGPMLVSRFLEQQIPQSRRLAFAIDYNDDVIKVHARKLYDLLLPHLWLTAAPPNPVPFSLSYEITEGVYSLAVKLLRKYMTIASTHKHRAYQGECEVRLLESTGKEGPGDRLKHRLRGYDLLPYTDFIWAVEEDTSPLVSITAGPATDWLKASNFLHTCTTRFAKRFHHEGQIRFAQSTNPYAVV